MNACHTQRAPGDDPAGRPACKPWTVPFAPSANETIELELWEAAHARVHAVDAALPEPFLSFFLFLAVSQSATTVTRKQGLACK